jgi:hypothetical protein
MVYGSGDVRKHASLNYCKPRLFKPVEYLDHTGFRKQVCEEIMRSETKPFQSV